MKLTDMPNIGKTTEAGLIEVGIETPEQLREVGSREAFLRMQKNDSGLCVNVVMGLEGAIRNVRKGELPAEIKDDLKAFFNEVKIDA